jgi:hypothetical protein
MERLILEANGFGKVQFHLQPLSVLDILGGILFVISIDIGSIGTIRSGEIILRMTRFAKKVWMIEQSASFLL